MKHDYNENGIDATTGVTVPLGFVQAHKYGGSITVEDVVVEMAGTDADNDFNIEVGGSDVFSAEQTATNGAIGTFTPDQNREATGEYVQLDIDISAANATTGTMNVSVMVDDGREE